MKSSIYLKKYEKEKEKKNKNNNHKRKVSPNYNLLTEFPRIAKQWNYIKNGPLLPTKVSPKGNTKVWWTCEYNYNHIWQDRIANRTILNRNCPICSKLFKVSFPARALYFYLQKIFFDCEIEYRILKKYTVDIFIPSYSIIIEYDGWYYHSSQSALERKKRKDEFFIKNKFDIIHIEEVKNNIKKIEFKNNTIKYHLKDRYIGLNHLIEKTLSILELKTNNKISLDIDIYRDFEKIEDLYYHIRKSNSLAVKYPEIAADWSPDNPLTPDNISIANNYKAKWICPTCKKEYFSTINNRVYHNCSCIECSKKRRLLNNSLFTKYPDLSKEWYYEKNGDLLPQNVPVSSNISVWWKCENNHIWKSTIKNRAGGHHKCPYCSHMHLTKGNTLAEKRPDLCRLWDYIKNGNKTPELFSNHSNKIVWWICGKGHSWQRSINGMSKILSNEKCPICSNRIRFQEKSKL